jgi:hypothetical protein
MAGGLYNTLGAQGVGALAGGVTGALTNKENRLQGALMGGLGGYGIGGGMGAGIAVRVCSRMVLRLRVLAGANTGLGLSRRPVVVSGFRRPQRGTRADLDFSSWRVGL